MEFYTAYISNEKDVSDFSACYKNGMRVQSDMRFSHVVTCGDTDFNCYVPIDRRVHGAIYIAVHLNDAGIAALHMNVINTAE